MNLITSESSLVPWVLVCGGFNRFGGMDRANLTLCHYLLDQGRTLFLVGHNIDTDLLSHPAVHATAIRRPLDSILLGERALSREGMRVANLVTNRWPGARVVVNGGNCPATDINWVHSVHSAWPTYDQGAPTWFRAKNFLYKAKARRDERVALSRSRVIIANSKRTRLDLVELGIPMEKIRIVYLGSDPEWQPANAPERKLARKTFGVPSDSRVVCFVGALGYDQNKGFDTLLSAFVKASIPNCHLLVAGGGRGIHRWKTEVERSRLKERIKVLGFTKDVGEVYRASDLLVSPVRYEAFGLNVLESICRGVPAIVSATSGVAELYPDSLRRYLLGKPDDKQALTALLQEWADEVDAAKHKFERLSHQLRSRRWKDMAAEFVEAVEANNDSQSKSSDVVQGD